MKAYIQNLTKSSLSLEFDEELSATESHECQGINGCLQWVTRELLHAATEAAAGSCTRRCQKHTKSLRISEEHENSASTLRVLDLTSCGLIGVSDASMGGRSVRFISTDQSVNVCSQAGMGTFLGENHSCLWVQRQVQCA